MDPDTRNLTRAPKSRAGRRSLSFSSCNISNNMVSVKRRLSIDASEDSNHNKAAKTDELSREERQERVFANMRLRRIIKENHASTIHQLAFFFNNKNFSGPVGIDMQKTFDKRGSVQREQTDTSNVLASVGGCQVHRHT